jgi:hypothetical protein
MFMTVWQVGAGETGRDYSKLCLEHDVVMIGPGDPGAYNAERYSRTALPHLTAARIGAIRSFALDPKPGDIVLLRLGQEAVGAGVVPHGEEHDYKWREDFDDVLGWNLQHTRRVRWLPEGDRVKVLQRIAPVFGKIRRLPMFTRVNQPSVTALASELAAYDRPRLLRELPEVSPRLSDEELGVELFTSGLPNAATENVLEVMRRARRLIAWYDGKECEKRPSEHEVVAHIIVPLLQGLGWSEQLMAVEWNRIDLALFCRPPTTAETCVAVCEAKSRGSTLERAYQQAKAGVAINQLAQSGTVITTDGARLLVYRKTGADWPDEPQGYANLLRMRRMNLIPRNTNAAETIIELLPTRLGR